MMILNQKQRDVVFIPIKVEDQNDKTDHQEIVAGRVAKLRQIFIQREEEDEDEIQENWKWPKRARRIWDQVSKYMKRIYREVARQLNLSSVYVLCS